MSTERVAGPTEYGELVPAAAGLAIWLWIAADGGWLVGLEYSFLLLIALMLGGWALLMRLRYDEDHLARTIGPWRLRVDLTTLESVRWKMTGGWRSRGTIFVRDRRGGRVPIYVGRFKRPEEWGQLLLESAERSGAEVDHPSRVILSGGAE